MLHEQRDGSDGLDGSDGADAHGMISAADIRLSSQSNAFNIRSCRAARVVGGAALGLIVMALVVHVAARGTVVATIRSEASMGILMESRCENPQPHQNFKGHNMLDHPIITSSSDECGEKCSWMNGCLGWTFVWGNQECWPKDAINSTFYDEATVSCMHEAAKSEAPKQREHWASEAPNQGDQGVSLFCFAMMRVESYEPDLLRRHHDRGAGIFACDTYALFCTDAVELLPGINTIQVASADVQISEDGAAANTQQFMNVWDGVKQSGRFYHADWTIKVDPDCVFLPWKLRPRLVAHNGEYAFVRNCNAWPGSDKFPCMFGAIEVLSQTAVGAFVDRKDECRNLPVGAWAEDLFITKCLEQLGVHPIDDNSFLADGLCSQSLAPLSERPPPESCSQDRVAAFHPFKDIGAWEACLDQAKRAQ